MYNCSPLVVKTARRGLSYNRNASQFFNQFIVQCVLDNLSGDMKITFIISHFV